MGAANLVSLDYNDIIASCAPVTGSPPGTEFSGELKEDWGRLAFKHKVFPNLRITHWTAEVSHSLHIRQRQEGESASVNSCFSLGGRIESSFHGFRNRHSLTKGFHNFLYNPVVEDDHYVDAASGPMEILHIAVDREYYLGLLGECEGCGSLRSSLEKKMQVSGFRHERFISPAMRSVIADIVNGHTGPVRNLLLEAKVLELTAHQLSDFTTEAIARPLTVRRGDRDALFALRDYLETHFDQDHSLYSLARAFALNEFKLKKGFRQLFDCTVFEFIHRLRMQKAYALIAEGRHNVCEVSRVIGYKNPNHFSAAFKKEFGFSPSALRPACALAG